MKIANIRKFLAAASGAAATLVSVGLLSGAAERWTTAVLAVLSAAAVYLIPNGKKAAKAVVQPAAKTDAGYGAIDVLIFVLVAVVVVWLVVFLVGHMR